MVTCRAVGSASGRWRGSRAAPGTWMATASRESFSSRSATARATLADLDGDGRAEIIVVDEDTATLRAWHGDGSPAFGGGGATDDGVIAHLGEGNVFGVSVAGPDDSGAFDFFIGNFWVHRER